MKQLIRLFSRKIIKITSRVSALFYLLIVVFVLFQNQQLFAQGCGDIYSALVFESKTGDILYQKKSDAIIYPASLTKLMTLYLTFEALKEKKITLDQVLTTSERAAAVSNINKNNSLKLKVGDHLTVDEAINGSIVRSFNETVVMLAEAVSNDEWDFVKKMNNKADELGMYHTIFKNASGLHDDNQYTTTYDLGRLVIALIDDFFSYYPKFSQKDFGFNSINYLSSNNLLSQYDGIEGMKTGFTSNAGYNLIAIAKRGDRRVVSIIVSCASKDKRDQFSKELLDIGFAKINNSDPLITRQFLQEKKNKFILSDEESRSSESDSIKSVQSKSIEKNVKSK